MVYTGSRALQLINGVTSMVSNLSFLFSILRALMMAGTRTGKAADHGHYAFAIET